MEALFPFKMDYAFDRVEYLIAPIKISLASQNPHDCYIMCDNYINSFYDIGG